MARTALMLQEFYSRGGSRRQYPQVRRPAGFSRQPDGIVTRLYGYNSRIMPITAPQAAAASPATSSTLTAPAYLPTTGSG